MSAPFSLDLVNKSDTWGPPKEVPKSLSFYDIPFAPFSKSNKLGKASDWFNQESTMSNQQQGKGNKNFRDPFHAYGANVASRYAAEKGNESYANDFEVVDNNKTAVNNQNQQQHRTILRGRGNNNRSLGHAGQKRNDGNNRGGNMKPKGPGNQQGNQQGGHQQGNQQGNQGNSQAASRNYWNTQNQNQIDDNTKRKQLALNIESNFFEITKIEFNKLNKLNLELGANGKGETLAVRANLNSLKSYNKQFDKLFSMSSLTRKPSSLRMYHNEATNSVYTDTFEDKVLMDLAAEHNADVILTEELLATIMSAHKSTFPWSMKIVKDLKTNKLYFKQSEKKLRNIVDENESDLFTQSFRLDDSNINGYSKLSSELETVNLNFVKYMSAPLSKKQIKLRDGHVIENLATSTNSKIHSYKMFKVPEVTHEEEKKRGNKKLSLAKPLDGEEEEKFINIFVRTTGDLLQEANGDAYDVVAVHALNQYRSSGLDWNTKLLSNSGAILSTEFRKNNNLFSKWIISSLLGDISDIKLGFVSREAFNSNDKHTLLGVFNYKPEDLASQINLKIGNGWGIFKSIVDIVNHEASLVENVDTVEFVLAKDPVSPRLTIYRVD